MIEKLNVETCEKCKGTGYRGHDLMGTITCECNRGFIPFGHQNFPGNLEIVKRVNEIIDWINDQEPECPGPIQSTAHARKGKVVFNSYGAVEERLDD